MKIKTLTVSIIIISLFIGCQNEEKSELQPNDEAHVLLSPEEILSIQYKESPELEQSEIFELLNDFQTKQTRNTSAKTRSNNALSFEVKRKYYITKEGVNAELNKTRTADGTETLIPILEVDLSTEEDKGIAIVSADRRAPYILAFIDNIDQEDKTLSTAPNALLEWAKVCIAHEVSKFELTKDSIYTATLTKITDELDINTSDISYSKIRNQIITENGNGNTRSTPIDYPPSNLRVLSEAGPFCPVKWDQRQPYNCKLPMGDVDIFYGWTEYTNYPAGIGVLSVAHLIACIQLQPSLLGVGSRPGSPRPLYINWNYLTENETIIAPDYFNTGDPLDKRETVGELFKMIYNKTESTPVYNSSGVVTGTTTYLSKIESYINSLFTTDGKTSWDINKIRNSILTNGRPVYVYGKADNNSSGGIFPFLIDGMMDCRGWINNVPKDIDISYLHANFGFGNGWQDGYYLMELNNSSVIFETSAPLIFKSSALTIIHNIRNTAPRTIIRG